jgi:lipoprotein-releasing system permease protein
VARLALAYLLHRPVQILAVFGVAIGLLALLVVLAVMNGLIEQDRIAVRGPLSDMLLIPAVTEEVPHYEQYRAALDAAPEVAATAPHLVAYALMSMPYGEQRLQSTRNSDSNAIQIVGIDLDAEINVTQHPGGFADALNSAKLAPIADFAQPFAYDGETRRTRSGVLVSDRLMNADHFMRPNSRIEVFALPYKLPQPGEQLKPTNAELVIAGTYSGSDYEMSMDRIYMQRTGVRKGLHDTLIGTAAPDFTEILIRLVDGVDFEQGRDAIFAALDQANLPRPGGEQGGALQTWEERRALFLGAIENERRVTTLVMFFIVVVAAFGIFATLSALVREKIRDLGVLAALGFSPIRRALLLLTVGSMGSVLGALLGYGGAFWLVDNHLTVERVLREKFGIEVFRSDLYIIDGLPVQWDTQMSTFLSVAAFLVGVLFTLGPALRAASLSPVEALRYE